MASFFKKDGKWRALVRRKDHKPVSKWFDTKSAAQAWADEIERQIDAGVQQVKPRTIADLITDYRTIRSKTRPILDTSTEHYTLGMLTRTLGDRTSLQTDDVVAWALQRRDEGAGPYTVLCDLSKLATVFRHCGGDSLSEAILSARPRLAHLQLIGGGGMRERRPTEEEMLGLLQWLQEYRGQRYADCVRFAVLTAMRRGEVAAVRWSDIDHQKKLLLVRNRKDPRKKIGNDQWVPLLSGAYDLVMSQPQEDERIFPIHPQTLSKYFKEGCDALGIPDLHFHDLRHEGISRLFEDGLEIQHVALVSGHKSWSHLRRYTNLKPESLHELHQDRLQHRERRTTASRRPDKSGQ